MMRTNALLLAILVACALGLVSAQHEARKLFVALAGEQVRAQALAVEWGQLQLEQSTWAMHSRVERIASQALQMQLPDVTRVRVLTLPPAVSSER